KICLTCGVVEHQPVGEYRPWMEIFHCGVELRRNAIVMIPVIIIPLTEIFAPGRFDSEVPEGTQGQLGPRTDNNMTDILSGDIFHVPGSRLIVVLANHDQFSIGITL